MTSCSDLDDLVYVYPQFLGAAPKHCTPSYPPNLCQLTPTFLES